MPLPGGRGVPEDLWRLVADGTDATSDFPTDRGWNTATCSIPTPTGPARPSARASCTGQQLNAAFFAMSPREALATDDHRDGCCSAAGSCWNGRA